MIGSRCWMLGSKINYQQAIQLYKTVNQVDFPHSFEHVTIIEQTECTSRQQKFKIFKNNNRKIGMNSSIYVHFRLPRFGVASLKSVTSS